MARKFIDRIKKFFNKFDADDSDPSDSIDEWLYNSPDRFFLLNGVRLALPDQTQIPKSIDKKIVQEFAKEGDPYWQYLLSRMYDNGVGVRADKDRRVYWLEQAAKQKYADAIVTLACLNIGKNSFIRETLKMFAEASQLGSEEAVLDIALLNIKSESIFSIDRQKSTMQLLDLCNKGNSRAKMNMAMTFLVGEEVGRDLKQCMGLLEEADLQGVAEGASLRAMIYNTEVFSDYYDPCKAFYCMARALRRDIKYFPECLYDFFYDGRYMHKNLKDVKHIIDAPFFDNSDYIEIRNRQLERWKEEVEKSHSIIATLNRKKNLEPDEHYTLAMEYMAGAVGGSGEKNAMRHLQEAAEQGYTPAQLELARHYYSNGDKKAMYWGKKAEKESDEAFFISALSLYDEDDKNCLPLLKEAAERGYHAANVVLGLIFQYGELGQKVDYDAARTFYEKGIEEREDKSITWYTRGFRQLAQLYAEGWGVPKDEEKAMALLKEGYAYDDLDCAFALTRLYRKGDRYDKRMAFDILLFLSRYDEYFKANASLASYYMRDSIHPMDPVAALAYLEEGYDKGNGFLVCLVGLVELSFSGLIPWLKPEYGLKLLTTGDIIFDWRIFYIKALMFDFGYLYEQDYTKARVYYEAAELCGCAKSMVNRALLLLSGLGGERDERLAIKLLREAELAGVESAKYNLSVIYDCEVDDTYELESEYEYIDPETKRTYILAKNCCQDILNFYDLAAGTFKPKSDCTIDQIPQGIEGIVKSKDRSILVVDNPNLQMVSIDGYEDEYISQENIDKVCILLRKLSKTIAEIKSKYSKNDFIKSPGEPGEKGEPKMSYSRFSKKSAKKKRKKK
ncbi:MAG: sel1 repeat family protein [Desulfovibrionaceae bacterium]|nr:sel1 repeat family protein [Desulfovibrionaceae bacterium]